MQEKLNQQQQARDLYFGAEHTQKQIADKVGVSERTVYGWIKHNSWAQLREAAFAAPAIINQNISNHIIALQNVISKRPIEERYPTKDESQIISRMLLCMDRLKKFPSLSQNLHMMQNFINTFVGRDMETAEKVTTYADQYFRSKTQNGFDTWEMEYQMEEKQYQTFTKNEAAKEEMACHCKPLRTTTQIVDNNATYAQNTTGNEPEVSRNSEVDGRFSVEEHDQKTTVIARNEATSRNTSTAPLVNPTETPEATGTKPDCHPELLSKGRNFPEQKPVDLDTNTPPGPAKNQTAITAVRLNNNKATLCKIHGSEIIEFGHSYNTEEVRRESVLKGKPWIEIIREKEKLRKHG